MAGVRYLLDTNVLSEPVVARPNPLVLERIRANGTSLSISSVTWQAVLYGMFCLPAGRRRDQIGNDLFRRIRPALPIIDFDERIEALLRAWSLVHIRGPSPIPDTAHETPMPNRGFRKRISAVGIPLCHD